MKVPTLFCSSTMEDSSTSPSQNYNGQISGGANILLSNNKHQGNDNGSANLKEVVKDQRPQYSMPGILHFIQHEWARFELERSQWELDRAEFQVCSVLFSFSVYLIHLFFYSALLCIPYTKIDHVKCPRKRNSYKRKNCSKRNSIFQ